jgi:hypothetical protein
MNEITDKATIGLLHQLGRSGGTVIAKCLAVMQGVILLSEVHPLGKSMARNRSPEAATTFSPLSQAHRWFGLFDEGEIERIGQEYARMTFADEIGLIASRCAERGYRLVLRDYNNVDFTGVQFKSSPPHRFLTHEALRQRFNINRAFTVRHPIDQWMSLSRYLKGVEIDLGAYLRGCRVFAETAREKGFVRYEDFSENPDDQLRILCDRLAIPFSGQWRDRWQAYTNITGDRDAMAGSREIKPRQRPALEPEVIAKFESNEDYRKIIELLDYRHP